MALPQDGQDANGLTKVTQIPAGKELMFIDPTTNEGGIITLEDLTKQILNGLASQAFALDAGQMTLPAALNKLNSDSKSLIIKKFVIDDKPSTLHIRPNKVLSHFSFLAFGDNNNNIFYAFGAKNSNYRYGCTVTTVSENNEFTISLSAWSYGIVVSADQFTCTEE